MTDRSWPLAGPPGSTRGLLSLVILLGLVLRAALFTAGYGASPERVTTPDTRTYELPALALLSGGRFSQSPDAPDVPETFRTPGYPAVIAACYLLFGRSHVAVIAVQLLMAMGTILGAYLLGRQLWGDPTAALLGALTLAVDPVSALHAVLVLSETTYALALTVAVLFWVHSAGPAARGGHAFLGGAALAVATLVRPVGYYLIVPVLALEILHGRFRGRGWRLVASRALLLVLPWILLVGGWQARNLLVAGHGAFATVASYNLLMYRGAGVIAARDGVSLAEAQERIRKEVARLEFRSEAERLEYFRREGLALLGAHPLLAVQDGVRGSLRMLFGPGVGSLLAFLDGEGPSPGGGDGPGTAPGHVQRPGPLIALGFGAAYLLLLHAGVITALVLLLAAGRSTPWRHLAPLGCVLYFIVLSGPESYGRFRMPVMPILCAYAGRGWAALVRAPRPPSEPRG